MSGQADLSAGIGRQVLPLAVRADEIDGIVPERLSGGQQTKFLTRCPVTNEF